MNTIEILQQIVTESLQAAYNAKYVTPKLSSAKFVEGIGKGLYEAFGHNTSKHTKRTLQTVKSDGSGKNSGEWLLDAVIWDWFEMSDSKHEGSPAHFLRRIHWAVESESDTPLKEMASDFNKLLAVNSTNYFYLNGINQKTEKGREDYRYRRLKTANDVLREVRKDRDITNFYFAFWPSPERIGTWTLWNLKLSEIVSIVSVHQLA